MTRAVPWIVVSPAADRSPAAVAAADLMVWLSEQSAITLHTVVWGTGSSGVASFDLGRLTDVSAIHRRIAPRVLRRVNLARVGGGLTGRAVRAAFGDLPRDGVLYLSSAQSGAVLRYLPLGRRTVVTHLHTVDRQADPPLSPDKVDRLLAVTDVWLAVDQEVQAWAADGWNIDPNRINVVPAPADPRTWNRATTPTRSDQLRLGLAGGEWFKRDYAAQLVQLLVRRRPELDLQLVWTRAVTTTDHLRPLLHDLERLGLDHTLELSTLPDGPLPVLDDIDALALTLPDEVAPWLVRDAVSRGVPIVCFDTHRDAHGVELGGGLVVPYPDVGAMAQAVLDIHGHEGSAGTLAVNARRSAMRERDVALVGPRIVELAQETSEP